MLEPTAAARSVGDGLVVVSLSNPLTKELREIFFQDDEAVAVYRALYEFIQGR